MTDSIRREARTSLDAHYSAVIKELVAGRVVPFLGAGANLCGRPEDSSWRPNQFQYLPNGAELATFLGENFGFTGPGNDDLVRVSQYISVMIGAGPLYEELHKVLDADYPPTPLHVFLAMLPSMLRQKGYRPRHQLIVTTNYDDLIERAFKAAGEPFDLVSYVAEGDERERGKFRHWSPVGDAILIERPNEYTGLSLDQRPIVLKIHGAVDRSGTDPKDSFVITEDHYIDYLTRTDLASLVPVPLPAKLRKSHLLFLGYGLRDWNLRVILHRIAGEQKLSYKSWAIQAKADEIEKQFWKKRDVDILEMRLEEYVAALTARVRALPSVEAI